MSNTYLITGIAGFIGSHIAEEILNHAPNDSILVGLDNFYSGNTYNLQIVQDLALRLDKKFFFYEGDIRDNALLDTIFSHHKITHISHQAAIVSVQTSLNNPKLSADVNIKGLLNVLELAALHKVKRFIFASSAAIYGDCEIVPKDENSPIHPISPYGYEKLMGEHYLSNYSLRFGIETCAFRYFNVYGPRQDPSSPYSGVISIFNDTYKKIISGVDSTPPIIYGDGTQFRDFIYVKDVAKANYLAFHNKFGANTTYCLGTGKKQSLNDLIEVFNNIYNLEVTPSYASKRQGDPHASQSNNEKYKKAFDILKFVSITNGLRTLNQAHQTQAQNPLKT